MNPNQIIDKKEYRPLREDQSFLRISAEIIIGAAIVLCAVIMVYGLYVSAD